jgi:protein gp37
MENHEEKVDARKYIKWEDHKGKTHEIEKKYKEKKFKQALKAYNHYAGWIWNPVTGCLNSCPQCLQRTIAEADRLSNSLGFDPLLRHDRLMEPSKTVFPFMSQDPKDWRVLVCNEGDLFGEWVPDHWIEKVIEATKDGPFFRYLF